MSQSSNPVVGQATEQEKNVGSVVIRGVLDAEAGQRVTAFICANASNATPEATAARLQNLPLVLAKGIRSAAGIRLAASLKQMGADAVFLPADEASAPTAPRIKCPKCGYERQESDDLVDAAVCPQCQIVYSKWSPLREAPPSTGPSPRGLPVDFEALVYPKERTLFKLMAALAVVYWLCILLTAKGTFLLLLFFLAFMLLGQSALLAHLKGNGVKVSADQFPDLYSRHLYCCRRLAFSEIPDMYVMNGGGILNAFASRFLGRNFVVLYSNVVQAMADQPGAINFYIGHELGHIKQKHLVWGPFLWPGSLLPLLGAAYSRAREYTCDQFGAACCEDGDDALRGLIALSAGEKLWSQVNTAAYIRQAEHGSGFWMSLHELASGYPWLVKRAARIDNPLLVAPPRNKLAYALAVFMPPMGAGGSLAGIMVAVAILGILAAIAVPQFQQYKAKAAAHATSGQRDSWQRENSGGGRPGARADGQKGSGI